MNEEARKARNEYAKNWRKKNPDKVKQAQEKYWNKKAAAMKQTEDEKTEQQNS